MEDATGVPARTSKLASLGFDEIRVAVYKHYAAISALDVEYTQTRRSFWSSDAKDNDQIRLHFAMKGAKRLRSQFPVLPTSQEIEETWAFNGACQQTYLSTLSEGTIKQEKESEVYQDAYVHALGIPLQADRVAAAKSRYFQPHALDRDDLEWRVRPCLELVESVECHVIESKEKHALWVDPIAGFAIRWREIYARFDNVPTQEWSLATRYWFRDYRSFNETWLPMTIDIVTFHKDLQSAERRPDFSVVNQAVRIAVNDDVSDRVFELAFPPQTTVRDAIRKRVYVQE